MQVPNNIQLRLKNAFLTMLIMQCDTEIEFQNNCPDTYTNQNA